MTLLEGWTDEALFEEAVVAPRYAFERFDGLTVVEREGWLQLIAPAFKQGGLNGVAHARLDAREADAVIDETIATYRRLGLKWDWTVSPDSAPADLADRLARRGLARSTVRVMARSTAAHPAPLAPGLSVEVVDEASVEVHGRTMAEGWGMDPGPLVDFGRLLLSAPGGRHALFLARVDGLPVGGASLTLFARSAYLIGAVVLPRFRRRGVYRALTSARLAWARARGRTLATCHARAATSAPLLAAGGFTAVCDLAVFDGPPGEPAS